MVAEQKNFKYGDLWPGQAPEPRQRGTGRVLSDPALFVNNRAFLNYIDKHGFDLFLDYDMDRIAYTTPSSREIVVNANYPDDMIGPMIQHELGHLMLFNASQFVSVYDQTMRSMIAKVLYTPNNLRDYGLRKLLKAENIIEDIIIETVAEGKCICHGTLEFNGIRAGVKHLDRLEGAGLIAREVCKNLLKEPLSELEKIASYEGLGGHLKSMIQELRYDLEEIDEKISEVNSSAEYLNRRIYKRVREISTLHSQIAKLEAKLQKHHTEKAARLKNRLEAKLRVIQSREREIYDENEAEAERDRALERLQRKRNYSAELLELLEAELLLVPAGFLESSAEDDGRLHANKTDHLLPDSDEEVDPDAPTGHSFDCGFPHPVTIDRSESRAQQDDQSMLKRFDGALKTRKLKLQEDELDNIVSNRRKLPENELSYFRSSKKEWDQTDMLKGKKKKRASGVNVLIGLDISGSMSDEWTNQFAKLSGMVEEFQEKLDIENIIYFTYNHGLVDSARDIRDLTLKASGGNAFAHVYQEIMQNLPIMQKNELILVTDCGDNLGWTLKDCVVAERNGVEVENHISIVDTEEAGFYDSGAIDEKDWSLHRAGDRMLYDELKKNIESLIDSR